MIKPFKPFILRIYTEKEAKLLWHILNCPLVGVDKYDWIIGEEGLKFLEKIGDLDIVLWKKVNKKYSPRKGRR